MAVEKVIVVKADTGQAEKSFEELGDIIQEQTDITIEFEAELRRLEHQLKETPKGSLAEQKKLKSEISQVKDAIKGQSVALKDLNNQKKKSSVATKANIKDTLDNGGAVALLDSVTGGLATRIRDSFEAAKLFNVSLKGMKKALIATGIGALVVALGLIVAYWDDIADAIKGVNRELEAQVKLNDDITKQLEQQKFIRELNNDFVTKQVEGDILRAKIAGASEKEIFGIRKKGLEEGVRLAQEAASKSNKILADSANADEEIYKKAIKDQEDAFKELGEAKSALANAQLEEDLRISEESRADSKKTNDDKWKAYLKENEEILKNRELKEKEKEQDAKDREEYRIFLEEEEQEEIDREDRRLAALLVKYEKEEELRKQALADEKAVADAKISIQNSQIDNFANGVFLISQLNEKSKALQSASIIADSAAGIAKIVINTQAANTGAVAKYALLPGGQALAAAEIAANKIGAGIGIASNVLATGKALSALGGGGGAPKGSSNLGGGGGQSAPAFNLVAGTGSNQIAEGLAKSDKPVKAFVVSSDVSTSQSLDRNIVQNSSL